MRWLLKFYSGFLSEKENYGLISDPNIDDEWYHIYLSAPGPGPLPLFRRDLPSVFWTYAVSLENFRKLSALLAKYGLFIKKMQLVNISNSWKKVISKTLANMM